MPRSVETGPFESDRFPSQPCIKPISYGSIPRSQLSAVMPTSPSFSAATRRDGESQEYCPPFKPSATVPGTSAQPSRSLFPVQRTFPDESYAETVAPSTDSPLDSRVTQARD